MPEVYVLSGGSITVLCIPTLMMHAVRERIAVMIGHSWAISARFLTYIIGTLLAQLSLLSSTSPRGRTTIIMITPTL